MIFNCNLYDSLERFPTCTITKKMPMTVPRTARETPIRTSVICTSTCTSVSTQYNELELAAPTTHRTRLRQPTGMVFRAGNLPATSGPSTVVTWHVEITTVPVGVGVFIGALFCATTFGTGMFN